MTLPTRGTAPTAGGASSTMPLGATAGGGFLAQLGITWHTQPVLATIGLADGAQLLLYGTQVCHQGIQVYTFSTLVQSLWKKNINNNINNSINNKN